MEARLLRQKAVFSFSTLVTSSGRHSGSDLISHFVDKTQNLVQSLSWLSNLKHFRNESKESPGLKPLFRFKSYLPPSVFSSLSWLIIITVRCLESVGCPSQWSQQSLSFIVPGDKSNLIRHKERKEELSTYVCAFIFPYEQSSKLERCPSVASRS